MKTDCAWIKEPTDCPHFADDCKDCDRIYDLSELSELHQRSAHNELVACGTDEGDTYYVRDIEWERKLP